MFYLEEHTENSFYNSFYKKKKYAYISLYKHSFIKNALNNGQIEVDFVATENAGDDILTTAFPSYKRNKC